MILSYFVDVHVIFLSVVSLYFHMYGLYKQIKQTPWLQSASELDRLYSVVVRVSGYRSRGPGFDSRSNQIFWEVVGLERGPLSLVSINEALLEWKSSCSGLENRN
jgi:hypothetical protein